MRVQIRRFYLVIDCHYNRKHYAMFIGKVLPIAPLFARCREV